MRKKLLALLLAAALALSLLAGCGGGESVASALLKLLDGRYPNISIEIDPELEADLRQAIRKAEAENAGDDAAVIRAALETALGSTITFRNLRNGQKGNTAFDLVFYAGSDPDKAAQAAYSQWNPILSNVPDDGKYDTSLAMVETNSGVWMLVKATVEKAGSRDDGPDPVTLKSLSVTGPSKTEYIKGQTFDSAGMTVTAHYSDGSTKTIAAGEYTIVIDDQNVSLPYLFTEVGPHTLKVKYNEMVSTNSVSIWVADENGYHEDNGTYVVTGSEGLQQLFTDKKDIGDFTGTITLTCDQTVKDRLADTFKGTLEGKEGSKPTITLTGNEGLFGTIRDGTVQNLAVDVTGTINTGTEYGSNAYATGAVADVNNGGSITGCTVTVNGSITATVNAPTVTISAGGLVGENGGTITSCTVKGGAITATTDGTGSTFAGGLVGYNGGTITSCTVEGCTIKAEACKSNYSAFAGGLVGYNGGSGNVTGTWSGTGTITAKFGNDEVSVPDSTDPDDDENANTAQKLDNNNICASAGTGIGYNHNGSNSNIGPVADDKLTPGP